jgi:hypothetical protein
MKAIRWLTLGAALSVGACASENGTQPTRKDGGSTADAGSKTDTGNNTDVANRTDGGGNPDAGANPDAGSTNTFAPYVINLVQTQTTESDLPDPVADKILIDDESPTAFDSLLLP